MLAYVWIFACNPLYGMVSAMESEKASLVKGNGSNGKGDEMGYGGTSSSDVALVISTEEVGSLSF